MLRLTCIELWRSLKTSAETQNLSRHRGRLSLVQTLQLLWEKETPDDVGNGQRRPNVYFDFEGGDHLNSRYRCCCEPSEKTSKIQRKPRALVENNLAFHKVCCFQGRRMFRRWKYISGDPVSLKTAGFAVHVSSGLSARKRRDNLHKKISGLVRIYQREILTNQK